MSDDEATTFGLWAWDAINLPNLRDNILPTREPRRPDPQEGRQPHDRGSALRRV